MKIRTIGARATLGLAVLAPIGAVGATMTSAAPAYAASGTSCSSETGSGTLSPGLSNTPAVQKVAIKAALSGCSGSVSSGKVSGTLTGTAAQSCATLGSPSTAKGTLTIKWNTGASSKVSITATTNGGSSSTTGKVLSGLFKGGKVTGTLTTTGANGNCTSTPITKETFSGSMAIS